MSQLQQIQIRRRSGFEDAYFSMPVTGPNDPDPSIIRNGVLCVRIAVGDVYETYTYPLDTIDHVRAHLVEE
jgi:hypothetical protein